MKDIASLIKAAVGPGEEASSAVAQLAAHGPQAGEAIVAAVQAGDVVAARRLGEVAGRSGSAKVVSAALELLRSEDSDASIFGFSVLRAARAPASLQPLVDFLLAKETTTGDRKSAVEVLGDLGDPAALDALHDVARTLLDPEGKRKKGAKAERSDAEALLARANVDDEFDRPNLAIAIAKACAQLGDHSLASIPIFFAGHVPTASDGVEAPLLRETSAEALQWVVGDGMIKSLRSELEDKNFETRRSALDALFYIGTSEIASDLLALAEDESLGGDARARFQDLTGAPDADAAAPLRTWWMKHGDTLPADICLRLGKPIVLDAIAKQLDEQNRGPAIQAELAVLTGRRFANAAEARAWIKTNANKFEAGGLYKSGRRQPQPRT